MYQLPKLKYLFEDLEPYIDTHTMGLHYNKHMRTYLNNLNKLLEKNNYDYQDNLYELLQRINSFSVEDRDNILFNLGGVLNHILYWESMNKEKYLPKGNLNSKIISKYGSFDNFWNSFKDIALKVKGSGYTFLVINKDREIEIVNTSNQDTPLLEGYIPLFNIDLWEHAYYLNYQNDRGKYIDNFKEIVSFKYAEELYERVLKNTKL